MERSRRKQIAFSIFNAVLMILIFVGMFAISVSTGFAAIGFAILGSIFGARCRTNKLQKEFYSKLIENKEDLFAGKKIVLIADDYDTISVQICEQPQRKEKKNKKKTADTKEE